MIVTDVLWIVTNVVNIIVWILILFLCSKTVYPYVIVPLLGLKPYKKWIIPGEWAVITGATDGIGKAFACELASRGLNIYLISRNQDRLDVVAEELRLKYKVDAKSFSVDFTNANQAIYSEIQTELQELDVGILINNVGLMPGPCFFHKMDSQLVEDMVTVNCGSYVLMAHLILPQMVTRKRGLVVLVSSVMGLRSFNMTAMYSATKCFEINFGRSLHHEYKDDNIFVQTLTPGMTHTKSCAVQRESVIVPSPQTLVKQSLNAVGTFAVTDGCLSHSVQNLTIGFLMQQDLFPSLWKYILPVFSNVFDQKKPNYDR